MENGKWKMETLRASLKVFHPYFPFSIFHLSFFTSYLSNQRLDRFELWRVSRPHYLKQRHLERGLNRSRLRQPRQRRPLVFGYARSDAIDKQINLNPPRKQIERRLQNTNVRFNAADQHLFDVSARDLRQKAIRATRAETSLLDRLQLHRQPRDYLCGRMLESLRILLGYDHRNFQQARAVHRPCNTRGYLAEVLHNRSKSLLHIDHRKRGRLTGKLADVAHSMILEKRPRCRALLKVFRSALSQYSSAIMTGTTLRKEEAQAVLFLWRQGGSIDHGQYASDDSGGSAGASSIFRAHFFPPRCAYFTVAGVPEVIDAGWTGRPDSRIEVLSSKASITSSLSFTRVKVLEPGSTV